jgi:hypothetical protein
MYTECRIFGVDDFNLTKYAVSASKVVVTAIAPSKSFRRSVTDRRW